MWLSLFSFLLWQYFACADRIQALSFKKIQQIPQGFATFTLQQNQTLELKNRCNFGQNGVLQISVLASSQIIARYETNQSNCLLNRKKLQIKKSDNYSIIIRSKNMESPFVVYKLSIRKISNGQYSKQYVLQGRFIKQQQNNNQNQNGHEHILVVKSSKQQNRDKTDQPITQAYYKIPKKECIIKYKIIYMPPLNIQTNLLIIQGNKTKSTNINPSPSKTNQQQNPPSDPSQPPTHIQTLTPLTHHNPQTEPITIQLDLLSLNMNPTQQWFINIEYDKQATKDIEGRVLSGKSVAVSEYGVEVYRVVDNFTWFRDCCRSVNVGKREDYGLVECSDQPVLQQDSNQQKNGYQDVKVQQQVFINFITFQNKNNIQKFFKDKKIKIPPIQKNKKNRTKTQNTQQEQHQQQQKQQFKQKKVFLILIIVIAILTTGIATVIIILLHKIWKQRNKQEQLTIKINSEDVKFSAKSEDKQDDNANDNNNNNDNQKKGEPKPQDQDDLKIQFQVFKIERHDSQKGLMS